MSKLIFMCAAVIIIHNGTMTAIQMIYTQRVCHGVK